ncbi:hypothetical protein Tco_1101146 [Tanacetum coccineum]
MQMHESKIDTGKAVEVDLVVTKSSGIESKVKYDNNRSRNDTDDDDADIRPIYDEEPMAKVQLTAECNIFAIGPHHTEQPELINKGKGFCNCCFKNDLRKLKGNSVDTKFDKTSVLGKLVLPSLRNQSVVRQPNAFKSERAQMSKQRFASQVDVNKNLEARKKTQERDRNSKTSVMPSARFQRTADGSKPKPRRNNQTSRSLPISKSSRVMITAVPKADHSKSSSSFSDSKNFVCSTCHKCVFNANHDACITKLLKEVNSRAKIQSHKTRNSNKPVDQKSHTQKPGRQIFTGHRFSPNKTSAVYEKTSPRSDLRWKPTGRIFKSVGLRWIPTGKLFDSCTSKVDSEPPHGSNVDIPHIHEANTLGCLKPQCQMASDHVSSDPGPQCSTTVLEQDSLSPGPQSQENVPQVAETVTTSNELELLYSPMFSELLNGNSPVVSKSFAVH